MIALAGIRSTLVSYAFILNFDKNEKNKIHFEWDHLPFTVDECSFPAVMDRSRPGVFAYEP